MADTVNSPVSDAVTATNVKVIAESPAMAMGAIYQTMAHSLGLLFENAVNAQNNMNILAQAATTQGVMQIYSIDTVASAIAIAQMAGATPNLDQPQDTAPNESQT